MLVRAVLFGLLSFLLFYPSVLVNAQTVTTKPDSAVVAQPETDPDKDRIIKTVKDKGLSKPGRAALYSAVIPGAGQVYNKHYWKVPVIYAVGGVLAYFYIDNNSQYIQYRNAYRNSLDTTLTTVPQVKDDNGNWVTISQLSALTGRNYYRRNRDLTLILCVLAYGMNIMEANVAAHLNEFDISDDLSLNVQPNIQFSQVGKLPTPGLTLNFRLKN